MELLLQKNHIHSKVSQILEAAQKEEVTFPFLGLFKARLDKVMSNLLWTGIWIRWTPQVHSNLKYSMNPGVKKEIIAS